MKTEKQILLASTETGNKLMENYEDNDRISVDIKELDERTDGFFENKTALVIPIIKKGVITFYDTNNNNDDEVIDALDDIYKLDSKTYHTTILDASRNERRKQALVESAKKLAYNNRIIHIFFDTEIEEDNVIITLSQVTCIPIFNEVFIKSAGIKDYINQWDYTLKISAKMQVEKGEYIVDVLTYDDAVINIYTKQKRKEEELTKYTHKKLTDAEFASKSGIEPFLKTMCYLNYLLENPEYKELDTPKRKNRTESKKEVSTAEQKKTAEVVKVREVLLNGIKVRTTNQKVANTVRSRQIHRVATCWGVRGHYRHYAKTGKVVYIAPYEKGRDAEKRIKKHYQIKA